MVNGKQILLSICLLSLFLWGCSKPEDYMNKGDQFFQRGDYEKAIIEYQKALKKNPKFVNAYYQIGITNLRNNSSDEALINFEKILEIDSKHIKTYIKMAEIYIGNNELDKANELLQKADGLIQDNEEILSLKIKVLSKKIESSPKNETLYLTLGEIYEKIKKYEEAAIQYYKIFEINPENEIALFRWAQTLELRGYYSDAIKKYQKISKKSSLFTQAQEKISNIQEMQGYKGAIWGMNLAQVSKSLHTELQEGWGTGIFGEWPTNFCFYELWNVPKTEFMGFCEYEESHVPEKAFRHYTTSKGDKCLFYNGRFCCYYFEVKAKNYDLYYNQLVSKDGNYSNKTFTVYLESDYQKSEPHNLTVSIWQKGATKILLMKDYSEAKTMGIAFTSLDSIFNF